MIPKERWQPTKRKRRIPRSSGPSLSVTSGTLFASYDAILVCRSAVRPWIIRDALKLSLGMRLIW